MTVAPNNLPKGHRDDDQDRNARGDAVLATRCGIRRVLRRELGRAGVERTEVNIWEDPEAAALVRSAARGNETVPTVVVGGEALVNPSVREVLTAMGTDEGTAPESPDASVAPRALLDAGWSVAAAAVWMLLALTQPTTTYHLAPLVAAVAWPLSAARSPHRSQRGRHRLVAVVGSALLSVAVLAILALADALEGPALVGSTAAEESIIAIAAGMVIGMALIRRRAVPRAAPSPGPAPATEALESAPGSGGGRGDGTCDPTRPDQVP